MQFGAGGCRPCRRMHTDTSRGFTSRLPQRHQGNKTQCQQTLRKQALLLQGIHCCTKTCIQQAAPLLPAPNSPACPILKSAPCLNSTLAPIPTVNNVQTSISTPCTNLQQHRYTSPQQHRYTIPQPHPLSKPPTALLYKPPTAPLYQPSTEPLYKPPTAPPSQLSIAPFPFTRDKDLIGCDKNQHTQRSQNAVCETVLYTLSLY